MASEGAFNIFFVPSGTFRMGSDRHYWEEAPSHHLTVGDFRIDRTPVTNRQRRRQPQIEIPRNVIEGGSRVCAPNYCTRYRPAARHTEDTPTGHFGL